MNQEKFEECLKLAREAKENYLTAYSRWFEKNRAWEIIVVAYITEGRDAKDAWYLAGASTPGKDALALLRDAEIYKEKAKYGLEIAICELKAHIEYK